ncbi:hypothetical protein [Maribellus maritimus]|uniref:hypothetical protein n=1 Tax=Maribellus maritimus TaxID=2870838 RepID=UPI001EEAAAA6|nr:hypothetical protein [Maribellus maritimus]MCG6191525.1 hypothetical protein [Maribellus maritimus]
MNNDKLKKQLLVEELVLLEKSVTTLQLSVDKCRKILQKKEYTFEDMESFDSLTSKFGRTSDLYTQKVIRTIWMLLHEPFVPFIDLLNKAEKIRLVYSADKLLEICDLRNQIAHEYIPEAVPGLVPEVIELTTFLFKSIEVSKQFIENRNWLPLAGADL